MPGELTPGLAESLVRLGTWLPFAPAAAMLAHFTRVEVSEATARRVTERAGAAYEAVQTATVEALERDLPVAATGPAVQQVSVDGVMVPLRGRDDWAEAKTLAIGTVQAPVRNREGEWEVRTTDLTYFARLTDHATFARLALVETQRRGVETAGTVCGVVDGAEWAQRFLDYHRPEAVRILDWAHAAAYVAQAGQAVFGEGTALAAQWIATQLDDLLHGDPEVVLGKLRGLRDEVGVEAGAGRQPVLETVSASLAYLEQRREQIRYAAFTAQGYPIGSGAVESGNKVLVEARLKGPGMHWARGHVNPMLALRGVARNDRWEEAWPQITAQFRQEARARAAARRAQRRAAAAAHEEVVVPTVADGAEADVAATVATRPEAERPQGAATQEPKPGPWRPGNAHPWRRSPIGKAGRPQAVTSAGAET